MQLNPGFQPVETIGKRVHVELVNGYRTDKATAAGIARDAKGWAADSCIWKLSSHPFSIAKWELTK